MRGAIGSRFGDSDAMPIGRRSFLPAPSGVAGAAGLVRALRVRHRDRSAHAVLLSHPTAESLKITYREHGELVPGALDTNKHYLRDFRNDQEHPIDVALLDEVCRLYRAFDCRGHFEVISGYRSPKTNEALRHVSTGVAKNSLHLEGRAIDVAHALRVDKLRDAAIALRSAAWLLPGLEFVHVDTGAFRTQPAASPPPQIQDVDPGRRELELGARPRRTAPAHFGDRALASNLFLPDRVRRAPGRE
jgi:uncharacterized protein YcbK (DUF882 family)